MDEKDFQNLWKSYPNHYHFQQKFDKNKRMNISMFWKNDTKLYTRIENKLGDYISLYHLTSNAKIHIYNYEFEVIDKIIHDVIYYILCLILPFVETHLIASTTLISLKAFKNVWDFFS